MIIDSIALTNFRVFRGFHSVKLTPENKEHPVILIGALNGAGKTTCFYCVTGLIFPNKGQISLDGLDITHYPVYRRARMGIGYLPQEASIFRGLNVTDNIRSVLQLHEKNPEKVEQELDSLLKEFSILVFILSHGITISLSS